VPIGTAKDGLPIGVQVIANHYEDRTALMFAALAHEKSTAN
jgi:Asp-tRNA(Asn)/Glu-tRNA(Gln) amidotransferase A subunit family amidase